MKQFCQTALIILLLPIFTLAQSNYKPGYVVTLKGDTLRGFIDYKEWYENPESISFKNDLNTGKIENFSPKSADAFTITGFEYYQRFILPISQGTVDINNLPLRPDTSYLTDTVFLRIITKGSHLTLYSYADNIKPRFYVLESSATQPLELIYQAYNDPNAEPTLQYINRYRTQLENLAQKYVADASKISGQILQSKYNEAELTKIVQNINGNSSVQFTQKNHTGTRWFAGAGVNYSSFEIGGTGSAFSGNSTANSFFPKIAAGIDLFGNKDIQRLILRAELSFAVNQFNISNSYNSNGDELTTLLNFKQYNTSITPQIIFNIYNKEQLKIFIDAGIGFNLSSYNHYQTITKTDGSSFAPVIQDDFPAFGKFWASFPVKAGVQLNKKVEISICYIPSSSITSYSEISGTITSYQLSINYLFGK